jgi:twitching motility protein PilT
MADLKEMLETLVERGGSDLHLTAGSRPRIRVDGELVDTEFDVLQPKELQKLIYSVLDSEQISTFEENLEADLSFGISELGRFRTNVFRQRGAIGAVMRLIPNDIRSFDELGLPADVCRNLCSKPRGLILVTGATGSGKSTTLASMIDYVNRRQQGHIMTIEDPIEYVHQHKKCLVNQREIGSDTHGFDQALRSVLRQDPDYVLIGEMRDQETIEAALTIAETGHLTFGTLHTSTAVQTINRLIDVFPSHQQSQIRTQLSFVLEGVFCQQLLRRKNKRGRELAAEVMLRNDAVQSLIREDKAHQIYSVIQTSGQLGMNTMNASLCDLYLDGKIEYQTALSRSDKPEELERMIEREE